MRPRVVDSTVEQLLDALEELGDVDARRMFGGHGIFRDGTMFAIVHQGRVYLKVDDDSRPDFEARGSEPFRPNVRQTLRTYYEVPADVLEDDAQLLAWADRAAAAAERAR